MRENISNFAARARLVAALLLLCAVAGRAQQQQPRPEQTVYLPDVAGAQAAPSGSEFSLNQLATAMLQLRLKALKGVRVVRQKAPECAPAPAGPDANRPPTQNAPAQPPPQQSQAPAGPQQQAPAQPPAADYYEIRSSITAKSSGGGGEPEMVLDYELIRYARCASTSVVRRSEPFVEQSALQSLTLMSDALALSVEEEMAPRKLVVEVGEFAGGGESRRQLRARLAEQVASQLAALGDVRPRLAGSEAEGVQPDYQITANITTGSPATVSFAVRNLKGGVPVNSPAQRIPAGQRNDEEMARFYTQAAERAVRVFTSVRLRDELSVSGTAPINEAWSRAQELMCVNRTDCDLQPEAAISILVKLIELSPTPAGQELLGDARRSAEDWIGAAQAYDEAWRATTDGRAKIPLLKKAGETWYQAKNFDSAADRIGQAVKLSEDLSQPALPAVYLQLARSHVFANNRVRALDSLVRGMRAIKPGAPRSKVLDDEFEELLKELKDNELVEAAPLMWANRNLPEVEDEMSAFTRRFVKELFEETKLALAEGRFKAADEALKKIESAPAADLLGDEREDAQRLRAEWQQMRTPANNANRPPVR